MQQTSGVQSISPSDAATRDQSPRIASTTIILALFIVIAILTAIALIAARRYDPPANPFSLSVNHLMGQSLNTVIEQGFDCQSNQTSNGTKDYCRSTPPNSKEFSEIIVILSDSQVTDIYFQLHENVIVVGNLIMLWGQPEVKVFGEIVIVYWQDRHITSELINPKSYFSYFLPALYVSFKA